MYIDPHKYDAIIDLPYIKSKQHKWMSRLNRAAQFAPFAALSGHEETMTETARRVNSKIELDEDALDILNHKIQLIIESNLKMITVTYFEKDDKKDGGRYNDYTGEFKYYDSVNKTLLIDDIEINRDDIINIDSPIFNTFYLDK